MNRTLITIGKLLASSLIIVLAFSSTAMAQAKSTSTTPQVDVENAQPNAISYGSTRSNKQTPTIKAPTGETEGVLTKITSKSKEVSNNDHCWGCAVAPLGVKKDVSDEVLPETQEKADGYIKTYIHTSTATNPKVGETPDAGDVTERANINTSRSNKKNTIAAPTGETPAGCVTKAGAKDANCNGVDDALVKAEEGNLRQNIDDAFMRR